MGPSKGERALIGGPKNRRRQILAMVHRIYQLEAKLVWSKQAKLARLHNWLGCLCGELYAPFFGISLNPYSGPPDNAP